MESAGSYRGEHSSQHPIINNTCAEGVDVRVQSERVHELMDNIRRAMYAACIGNARHMSAASLNASTTSVAPMPPLGLA
eukprot:9405229-Alexandrium_andersonii.AAC.1